ncbi:NAD-dependent deacetylase [Jatrophihabitans endophyticus]|uniref:protein acetyllysine N-acetyltransferase n=1 Tax=Jatrophihabitans endophyticus TaxID=1206085 RepID=A0A1M5P3J0_9ACTN|nr:Sir2 family NAD-dependent protein deacetylase [Jatrophihabitans endophyticus]SHG96360.1 NAD-dependent deacetylase [Jatrophihabitans endophyticus]
MAVSLTVLTGAGISTDSGIPDYRGPQGLWREDPDNELLVTYDYYVADPEIRRRSWLARQANPAWNAEPNVAHRALAARPDTWIVTQNVDRLHQRAGSPSNRVLELHGNMVEAVCIECGAGSTTQQALDRLAAGDPDPRCVGCGGILKTATVMFGQLLDESVLVQASAAARAAEVFVAIGTSLQVHPAAGLVDLAARAGARIVIVNAEPTPYDDLADEVIREPIGEAVPALLSRL